LQTPFRSQPCQRRGWLFYLDITMKKKKLKKNPNDKKLDLKIEVLLWKQPSAWEKLQKVMKKTKKPKK
jgi:hypothetical protein